MQINPEALMAIRTLAGFSQTQLAAMCGLSQSYISELEKGATKKSPSPEVVHKIADMLGVPVGAIYSAYVPPVDGAA
jgi:transcriptional regulator with XRE-family HTH domain